ncbi:unnamed protein product [Effrenium voratum]|nr:unnamed protein product [Effrenium voratum]
MYQRRTLRRLQDLCSGRGFSDRARLLEDIRDRAKHRTEVANAVQRLLQHGPLKNAEEAAICAAALSRRKLWAQGLELVKDFEGAGSTTGLNAAINTCRAGSNWELGLCLAMESAAEWDAGSTDRLSADLSELDSCHSQFDPPTVFFMFSSHE